MTREMSSLVILTICLVVNVVQSQQPCSGFPWTTAWQQCFQNMMSNIGRNTMDVIAKSGAGGNGMSSSSSSKNGVSSLSMSVGKTKWTVKGFGVRLSSSMVGESIVVQAVIGSPISETKKVVSGEEMRIDFTYPPDTNIPPKWITINIVHGPPVSSLLLTRKKQVLVIQNP